MKDNRFSKLLLPIIIVVCINILATFFFKRVDVTNNQRFSLAETSHHILASVEEPILIEVFLKGDFPSEYKRLQNETRYLLEEYAAQNPLIKFSFINPLAENIDAQSVAEQFYKAGMIPETINVNENGKISESIMFPWAMASNSKQAIPVKLLHRKIGDTNEDIINASIQQLEYVFSDAFKRLTSKRSKKIAIMRGNGELADVQLADFLTELKKHYFIAPFTLDSVANNPQKTLQQLSQYDLILEAKPTHRYTEKEKYVLDQYLMNGGKAIWLLDNVMAEKDSLFTSKHQRMLTFPRDLNLTDFFFQYGVRINPSLVTDVISAPIVLANGQGDQTRFNPYPWVYAPLAFSNASHPIVKNIEAVKFDFASPIDTLRNNINKTILLSSSENTKLIGTPTEVSLAIINTPPNPKTYNQASVPLAVLLEGSFKSVYQNRVKPINLTSHKDTSTPTKVLVVSDGDIIKNEMKNGKPMSLGYDPYTATTYGNKDFLINAINYMLDDDGLLTLRAKNVQLAFLDTQKVESNKSLWQWLNLGIPLICLGIFGFIFVLIRKKQFIKK